MAFLCGFEFLNYCRNSMYRRKCIPLLSALLHISNIVSKGEYNFEYICLYVW